MMVGRPCGIIGQFNAIVQLGWSGWACRVDFYETTRQTTVILKASGHAQSPGFAADRADCLREILMRRWAIIGLLLTTGCLEQNKPTTRPMIPLTRVPAIVQYQARARLPGVRYHTAWKLPNGGFQMRGNDAKGISHDVELTSDGSILSYN